MKEILDFLIIGAGPAGLSAAVEAKRAGIEKILVLEKGPSHSQMIRTFYKEGKRVDAQYAGQEALCFGILCLRDGNRESFLSFMDYVIEDNKIPIQYGVEVWSIVKNDPAFFEIRASSGASFWAKTVIVAIGKMGKAKTPDYWKEIPNDLKNNKSLVFDINSRSFDGLKVLVVGGGDSACEYAQLLSGKSEVTLCYRQSQITRANEINRQMTEKLISDFKIRPYFSSLINKIENLEGKPNVHFAERPAETFDVVLFGLGGITPFEFLRSAGVKVDEKGEALVSDIKESSVPGIFIVGDLLGKNKGGGSIISGFNSSSAAIRAILKRDFGRNLEAEVVSLDHMQF